MDTPTPPTAPTLTPNAVQRLRDHFQALTGIASQATSAVASQAVRTIAAEVRLAHPDAARVHLSVRDESTLLQVTGWATADPEDTNALAPAHVDDVDERASWIDDTQAENHPLIDWNEPLGTGWIDIDAALNGLDPDALGDAVIDFVAALLNQRIADTR